jgi:hypothetical protein
MTPYPRQATVNLSGTLFSFALFQATTEPEGFDNLTFEVVPEPNPFLLGIIASICFLVVSRNWLGPN